jgi:hypothetical protein
MADSPMRRSTTDPVGPDHQTTRPRGGIRPYVVSRALPVGLRPPYTARDTTLSHPDCRASLASEWTRPSYASGGIRSSTSCSVPSPCDGCLSTCRAPHPSTRSFLASILHPRLVVSLSTRNLPVGLQDPDGLDRVKTAVEHPVVGRAQPGEIVGGVVQSVLVEVRDLQAGFDLQTAYCTALEGELPVDDTSCLGLFARSGAWRKGRQGFIVQRHDAILVGDQSLLLRRRQRGGGLAVCLPHGGYRDGGRSLSTSASNCLISMSSAVGALGATIARTQEVPAAGGSRCASRALSIVNAPTAIGRPVVSSAA